MQKMFFGASANIFEKAKNLRDNMTAAETNLWDKISNKQLDGHRFRRQHPIGSFIADFYCHKAKLVVEVDGGIHKLSDHAEYDLGRTYEIEEFGIKVIRFTNEEVMNELGEVLVSIKRCLVDRTT